MNSTQTQAPGGPPRKRIQIWVEDSLTEAYLAELWSQHSSIVGIQVAMGSSCVSAAVQRDRKLGYTDSFGICDKDFDTAKTHTQTTTVFQLQRFEIENYLLDWNAMNAVRSGTVPYSTTAITTATSLISWIACCNVIRDLRFAATDNFPVNPPINIGTASAAQAYIVNQPWFATIASSVANLATVNSVNQELAKYEQLYSAQLPPSNQWLETFSGKEVMKPLWGLLGKSPRVSEEDIARKIAQQQRALQTAPAELDNLFQGVAARVGIQL